MSCGRTRRCLKFAIRNQTGRDGFDDYGYTVTCPHYAGMVMAEYREHVPTFERLLFFGYHSPMNAVESIAVDGNDRDYWNHHTRSWTLSLQTLGLRRALSGDRYVPYQELRTNNYLRSGYEELMPGSEL